MARKKNIRVAGVSLLLVFLLISCNNASDNQYPFVYQDQTMGTTFSIKVTFLPENVDGESLKVQIKSLLNEINLSMSTYIDNSEISLINRSNSTDWQTISPGLFEVLKAAQSISNLSDGAFDVSVGPLVNLWGFGAEKSSFSEPEKAKIQDRLNKIGYKHLLLSEDSYKIKKRIPDFNLDLSALAKGYAVDQVGLLLEKRGILSYLVEIGGEIRLKGKNIDQQPWRIAIEKPVSENRMIQKILNISDTAMATSGDYRNYFEENGTRFSHTIDPRTGYPITHRLASVTIVNKSAMVADALATAIMVLGPDEGFKMAEQNNIAALIIIKTDVGFMEKNTQAFINYLH